MTNANFVELNFSEQLQVNGGGWDEVFNASVGSMFIGHSVVIGVVAGVAFGPVAGVALGVACVATGAHMLAEALD